MRYGLTTSFCLYALTGMFVATAVNTVFAPPSSIAKIMSVSVPLTYAEALTKAFSQSKVREVPSRIFSDETMYPYSSQPSFCASVTKE